MTTASTVHGATRGMGGGIVAADLARGLYAVRPQYLARLKAQQEAQFAHLKAAAGGGGAPAPAALAAAPGTPARAVVPGGGGAAAAVAAPSPRAAVTMVASAATYPMECICLKRTIVRQGYEMSSKQVPASARQRPCVPLAVPRADAREVGVSLCRLSWRGCALAQHSARIRVLFPMCVLRSAGNSSRGCV